MATHNPNGLKDPADIPQAWKSCLTALQVLWPTTVLAGGALRDRDMGVKVKDLDFFLPSETGLMADLDHVKKVLDTEGWRDTTIITDETYMLLNPGRRMVGVVETRFPGCPPVQLVLGQWDMDNLIYEFDFGICQIMFDGNKITRSHQYTADKYQRLFRYALDGQPPERFDRSVERYCRIKSRYPGWRFASEPWNGWPRGGTITGRIMGNAQPNIQQLSMSAVTYVTVAAMKAKADMEALIRRQLNVNRNPIFDNGVDFQVAKDWHNQIKVMMDTQVIRPRGEAIRLKDQT